MDATQLPATPEGLSTLILSFCMPILIAKINHAHWRKDFKAIIAFLACIAAAALKLGIEGKLNPESWAYNSLLIFALTIMFFQGFWKPTGVAGAVEIATTPKPKEES